MFIFSHIISGTSNSHITTTIPHSQSRHSRQSTGTPNVVPSQLNVPDLKNPPQILEDAILTAEPQESPPEDSPANVRSTPPTRTSGICLPASLGKHGSTLPVSKGTSDASKNVTNASRSTSATTKRRSVFSKSSFNKEATDAAVIEVQLPDPEALMFIWCTYAREAQAFDQAMMTSWNKMLDIRLLFSGIFSAILTPFIAESYKLLQRADPFQPLPPLFGPDGYKVRVNVMWFSSLIFSLVASMLSILCKQWLDGYEVDLLFTGTGEDCPKALAKAGRLRQYRYQGLYNFGIPSISGTLPFMLYTAITFFAFGLVDFMWHLNEGIAVYLSILCGIVAVFHIGTTLVPCFTTASPFKTPLSNFLGNLSRRVRGGKSLEEEELEEVRRLEVYLDEIAFTWLMSKTRSDDVYGEASRAQKEHRRLQAHNKKEAQYPH